MEMLAATSKATNLELRQNQLLWAVCLLGASVAHVMQATPRHYAFYFFAVISVLNWAVCMTTFIASLTLPPHRRRYVTAYPSSRFVQPQPQWQKRKRIGSGSFGQVYLGFDSESRQFCAIKEIDVPDSLKQREQLNRENYLHRQLSHPNIVQYYGSNLTDNVLSIYMEYVSGDSIHRLLMKSGPFKESLIRSYTKQTLFALAYLHGRNIVHRDIKGANILVGRNGEIKLADFGMAKLISSVAAIHSAGKGTPYWMAPEVIMSVQSEDGYNLLVDIWSLGCTVIEMATGKHPWHDRCTPGQPCNPPVAGMHLTGFTNGTPEIPECLSEQGKDFLWLCLQRDPRDRRPAHELISHPFLHNRSTV